MRDEYKTKEELINELTKLRQRIAELKRSEIEHRRVEKELCRSEESYRSLIMLAPDGIVIFDMKGTVTSVNPAGIKMSGYSKNEIVGSHLLKLPFLRARDIPKYAKLLISVLRGEEPEPFEVVFHHKDGTSHWTEIHAGFIEVNDKKVGIQAIVRDITKHKQAEKALQEIHDELEMRIEERTKELAKLNEELWSEITERKKIEEDLRESEERYRTLFQGAAEGIFVAEIETKKFKYVNPAMCRILGYSSEELEGMDTLNIHPKESLKHVISKFEARARGEKMLAPNIPCLKKDGTTIYADIYTTKVLIDGRKCNLGFFTDITERRQNEEKLAHMATHDLLTNLPNRALFGDTLGLAIAHAHRNQQKLAVMMLDLDYFKNVNDTLGHSVGDKLLQGVGNRLRNMLRENDTIARIGGDEFLLLLPEINQIKDTTKIAQKILEVFQQPFMVDGHKISITVSIGIAIYPIDGEDVDILMSYTDIAMYSVKRNGRNNYQRYIPSPD